MMGLESYLDWSYPMPRVQHAAIITDTHFPEWNHEPTTDAFIDYIEETQPDTVIYGGDFMDVESMSSHGGNHSPPKLLDEAAGSRRYLRRAKRVAPHAKHIMLEGNHEDRLNRWLSNNAPNLVGAVSIRGLLQLDDMDIDWVPEDKILWLGKLAVIHGKWCNEHHAKKHLSEYGHSSLYGHTHRHQVFTKGQMNTDVHGAFGMPSACRHDAPYLKGKPAGWTQGFGVVYVRPDRNFNVYTAITSHGQMVAPNGKTYPVSARDNKEFAYAA
jgi:predicted phosphodiesterase